MKYQIKHISYLAVVAIIMNYSCSSEYSMYKRVGGNHLKLKSGEKELFWFSGIHGTDPKNPMFSDISTEFQKFAPEFVLVEGNANYNIPEDSIASIQRGESVFVAFLAKQQNIPTQSTEPSDSRINDFLLKKYNADDILSMYIIRQMVQWKRDKTEHDFEHEVVSFANHLAKELPISPQALSLDYITVLLKPHTGITNLNNTNWKDFDAKNYIYFSDNLINEIYEIVSDYRNIYLVEIIKEKINQYGKVFVMVGFDHAKEIKEELYTIFKNI